MFNTPCDIGVSMDGKWMLEQQDKWTQLQHKLIFSKLHYEKRFPDKLLPTIETPLINVELRGLQETEPYAGNNSGYFALQIAYTYRRPIIGLFGFDLTGQYWYPFYPWKNKPNEQSKYDRWIHNHELAAKQFEIAGIKVYNFSAISKLECYQKINFKEFLHEKERVEV